MSYSRGNYRTATDYLGLGIPKSNLFVYEQMGAKEDYNYRHIQQVQQPKKVNTSLDMKWATKEYQDTRDPQVWGPAFWFSLHNGAAHLVDQPSSYCLNKIQGFIEGIPEMLPCHDCKEHARAFIEKHKEYIKYKCITRDSLFNFFVDFHNYVNKRHNKPIMSYEDARKLYTNGARVSTLKY